MIFKKIVDRIIQFELDKRKSEIERKIKEQEDNLIAIYKTKCEQLDGLIKDVERVRIKAEDEQKRLWERLDIVRDSLNAEQIFSQLWSTAYSKAVDMVWDIMKEKTQHLVGLSKEDGIIEGEEKTKKQYDIKIEELISSFQGSVNTPLLFKKKEYAEKQFLIYQRSKDCPREAFYKGQLELIEEVTNGKKV